MGEVRRKLLSPAGLLDHEPVLVGQPVDRIEAAQSLVDRRGSQDDRQRVRVTLLVEELQPAGERDLYHRQRMTRDSEPLLRGGPLGANLGGTDP